MTSLFERAKASPEPALRQEWLDGVTRGEYFSQLLSRVRYSTEECLSNPLATYSILPSLCQRIGILRGKCELRAYPRLFEISWVTEADAVFVLREHEMLHAQQYCRDPRFGGSIWRDPLEEKRRAILSELLCCRHQLHLLAKNPSLVSPRLRDHIATEHTRYLEALRENRHKQRLAMEHFFCMEE